MHQIQNFTGVTALPRPLAGGEGHAAPLQEDLSVLKPSGLERFPLSIPAFKAFCSIITILHNPPCQLFLDFTPHA